MSLLECIDRSFDGEGTFVFLLWRLRWSRIANTSTAAAALGSLDLEAPFLVAVAVVVVVVAATAGRIRV